MWADRNGCLTGVSTQARCIGLQPFRKFVCHASLGPLYPLGSRQLQVAAVVSPLGISLDSLATRELL
jgi:hypothetical protein